MKAIFERLFRFLIILVGGTLTLTMSIQFFAQYNSDPTQSEFEMKRNKTFTIPISTLCTPLNDVDLIKISETIQQSFEQDFKYFNETVIDRNLLLEENWPINMIRVARYILLLTESYKALDQIDMKSLWQLNYLSVKRFNQRKAIDAFAKQLDGLNVTMDELLQKFGEELLKIYRIDVRKINGSLSTIELDIFQITYVGGEKVCYQIPFDRHPLLSTAESFNVKIDKCFMPLGHGNNGKVPINIDLLGRDTGDGIGGDIPLTARMQSIYIVPIRIAVEIQALTVVNGERRCSPTITQDNCATQCRIAAVEQQCNCTPSSNGKHLGGVVLESITVYAEFILYCHLESQLSFSPLRIIIICSAFVITAYQFRHFFSLSQFLRNSPF